ncbi:MAG TPA: DUF4833 domain-containing protein [Polyangia bacterium]|jgi:hypothetical protein
MVRLVPLLLLLLLPGLCFAQSTQKLFHIERSKNKNEVHYDARLDKDGQLDAKEPVVVYWLLPNGKRSTLSWLERSQAYGFKVTKDKSGEFWRMVIVPAKNRPIKLYVRDGKARAEGKINGFDVFLQKLYINTTEGALIPTVNYIDLIGIDVRTGEKRSERVKP